MDPQKAAEIVNNRSQSPQVQGSEAQQNPTNSPSLGNKENPECDATIHLPLLSKPRLQELLNEVSPGLVLDDDVQEILLKMADSFVDITLNSASIFAKHRHAPAVEVNDVLLNLEHHWNMTMPGFGSKKRDPKGEQQSEIIHDSR